MKTTAADTLTNEKGLGKPILAAIYHFMTVVGLHENYSMRRITKDKAKAWKVHLLNAPSARKAKATGISKKIALVAAWCKWCVAQEYLAANPFDGLQLPARLVSSQKVNKRGFTDDELRRILAALLKGNDRENLVCSIVPGALNARELVRTITKHHAHQVHR